MQPAIVRVVVALVLCDSAIAANILFLLGFGSRSHHVWHKNVVESLAQRGHNLTVLAPIRELVDPPNVHYIHLEGVFHYANKNDSYDLLNLAHESLIGHIFTAHEYCEQVCTGILASRGFQALLDYPKEFRVDLIIYDFTCGPCLLGFLHIFDYPPLMAATAFNNPPTSTELIGGHKQPAYVPYYQLSYGSNMNMWQRALNVFLHQFEILHRRYFLIPKINEMAQRRYNLTDLPYLGDLEKHTALMLINTHPHIEISEPLPPAAIAVGGLHIKDPQPLPDELREFLDAGKKGAVLFSLGSNIRSDLLSKAQQKMFIEAFSQISELNYLWKFESEIEFELPPNVKTVPWVPQNDVLAHPKVRGFITHGGLQSTYEAMFHGVPMIALPFFADQHRNARRAINIGIAEKLDLKRLSSECIKDRIQKVFRSTYYRERVRFKSSLVKDTPTKPLEKAIWWIEWLLRHPDKNYLRSPVLQLGQFKSNLYDLILVGFIMSILLTIWLTRKFVRGQEAKRLEEARKLKKTN